MLFGTRLDHERPIFFPELPLQDVPTGLESTHAKGHPEWAVRHAEVNSAATADSFRWYWSIAVTNMHGLETKEGARSLQQIDLTA